VFRALAGFVFHAIYYVHSYFAGQWGILPLPADFLWLYLMPMNDRGRPPKAPEDLKSTSIRIPLTESELAEIKRAAKARDAKPITWARETILRAAKRT
jgi:hypothetical protein